MFFEGYGGGYPCATMTDGGAFLLGHFDSMFKLGSCGLEKIEYPGTRDIGYICGKVPGGALFCSQKDCYRYHDETESFETMPALDQESFSNKICHKLNEVLRHFTANVL